MKHTNDFTAKLSRLMKLSWQIQKNKGISRSKSLISAWALFSNEDIAICRLVQKLSGRRPVKPQAVNQFSLFTL